MTKLLNVRVKSVKLTADLKLSADEAASLGLLNTGGDLKELVLQIEDHTETAIDQQMAYEEDNRLNPVEPASHQH